MKHKRICYLLLGALSLSLLGCGKTTYVAEMPDGRIVGLEEEEAEAIMEFQEEAGITELQEEYEQYMEEEYEEEMQEELQTEPTESKLVNVTEEELEMLSSESDVKNRFGSNEIKGVLYNFCFDEIKGEIYAEYILQDEIYELEEEVEYKDVTFPVRAFGGTEFHIDAETFTVPSYVTRIHTLDNITANEYIFPNTVEYIKLERLFFEFEGEFTVSFPEGLECYGTQDWVQTFKFSDLKSITIPEGARVLDDTFYSCRNLENVTLPESLEVIGENAFDSCKKLESITIPSNVKRIENGAFAQCNNLTSLNLPDGLEYIGNDVFSGCDNLTEIIIPDSVTECHSGFEGIDNLQLLVFPKDYQMDENWNLRFNYSDNLERIVFPNTITDLDTDFPESVKTIEVPEDLVDYLQKKYPDIEVLAREE